MMHYQRGQTLPVWAFGTVLVLSLLFFLANYANAVSWQIQAQNAADSAASAMLSVQANIWNEESVALYAGAVDENRLRYLNQAIINTINGVGGCDPSPGGTCDSDYQTLVAEFNTALSNYTADVQLIGQGDQLSEGGQQADERKVLSAYGTSCGTGGGVNCNFAFTALDTSTVSTNSSNGNGNANKFAPQETDMIACANVPYFLPQLFAFAANASYPVVARAAAAVVPANSETFDPGTLVNPATGKVYQPQETQWAQAYPAPAYTVDFSGLNVSLNWYTAGAIVPYSGTAAPGSYTCL